MVNTRMKTKKTQSILNTCISQASTEDTDHQSTQPGALIGFNDDLLTEILLRLPVTSILRFKSVSKHWRWLLSHKSFTLRYDKLLKSPGIFVRNIYVPFDVKTQRTLFRSQDFCFDAHGIKILQSCNGLLLCSSDKGGRGDCKYYVFNPTTKHFAIIPSVPGVKTIRFMGLAFHQTDCVPYKLVCIHLQPRSLLKLYQIQIYSSDTRKWKISIESFSMHYPTFSKGVYWNGAIHWAPSYHSHMYFEIIDERLQTLPSPKEIIYSESVTRYFGESRGHLHLIVTNFRENLSSVALNVYEMLRDHSGWFVKYKLGLDELRGAFPQFINNWSGDFFVVMDVVRGEKEDDTFMVLTIPTKLITYNIHDKSFKHILNHDSLYERHLFEGYLDFHRYTETLASL